MKAKVDNPEKPKTMRTDTRIVIWIVFLVILMVAFRIAALPFLLDLGRLEIVEKQNNTIVYMLLGFAFLCMLIVTSRKTIENIFGGRGLTIGMTGVRLDGKDKNDA